MKSEYTRRTFVKTAAVTAAAITGSSATAIMLEEAFKRFGNS